MTTTTTTKSSLAQPRALRPIVPERMAGFRAHERRWRNASIILVERRKGKAWMYGSITLAAALWSYLYVLVRFG